MISDVNPQSLQLISLEGKTSSVRTILDVNMSSKVCSSWRNANLLKSDRGLMSFCVLKSVFPRVWRGKGHHLRWWYLLTHFCIHILEFHYSNPQSSSGTLKGLLVLFWQLFVVLNFLQLSLNTLLSLGIHLDVSVWRRDRWQCLVAYPCQFRWWWRSQAL